MYFDAPSVNLKFIVQPCGDTMHVPAADSEHGHAVSAYVRRCCSEAVDLERGGYPAKEQEGRQETDDRQRRRSNPHGTDLRITSGLR
jgi:hypothetical protein